ncbi:MAG: aldo/keto reductase [Phycicoccus sp.]|nr:aldo/keto reductase [Phycicoccus sp.]
MEMRPLLGTDLVSSRLVLGAMTFGSQVDQETATAMVDLSLEAGINHFDTANAYNLGESERMLGRALGARRSEVIVATKVFGAMGDGPDDRGLSAAAVRKQMDASLSRLGMDYVDLYYLHSPDYTVPIEETLGAMSDLVREGKVRYVAASNYAAWQLCQMSGLSAERQWPSVRVSQVMYNLISRGLDDEYVAFAQAYGISSIVYNPLAGGLLTGKHRPDSVPIEGSRFNSPAYRDRYWTARQFSAVDQLRAVAEGAGISLIELSLRWLLASPLVEAVLVGASGLGQLEVNIAAADGPALDKGVMDACDEVWRELRGPLPHYNR